MQREEIEQVKVIVRQIAKEEIALAIQSLREELKTKPELIKTRSFSEKKEVKENAE